MPPGPAPLHIVKVKAQPHEKDGQRKKVNSIRRQTGGQASTQHPGASEGHGQDSSSVWQESQNDGPDP